MKIREKHTRDNRHPVSVFVPRYFHQSSTCTKPIPRDSLHISQKHISKKGTGFGLSWNPVTGECNMSQEEEGPHSDDKESFKELKDKP